MNFYNLMSIVLTFAVGVTYLNHRYIKMQPTIAIMFASLSLSLVFIIIGAFSPNSTELQIESYISKLDFHALLINGMLSFLLFAGALTVDINALFERKWEIGILATLGTIASTIIIGIVAYYLLKALGIDLSLIYCMLFGALISPTDPIAVLAMCKEIKAPRQLSVSIAGESLFNDGVGIVIFLTIYQLAFGSEPVTFGSVSLLFLQQAIGGIIYGGMLGLFAYWLIKPIQDHKLEILITLSIVTGGYVFAEYLHISGPLAMVVAGIFLGNTGKRLNMPKKMSAALYEFWELIDEILNAVLFLLIGFEVLIIDLDKWHVIAGLISIIVVLLVRFIVVALPFSFFKIWRSYSPHIIKILTWGGLRGGLAVALALALPIGPERNTVLTMTYAVVIFSILIQGVTIKSLVKKATA